MRTSRASSLVSVVILAALAMAGAATSARAQAEVGILPANSPQTAAEAALAMANSLDGAGGGISNDDLVAALEDAALAGQPMALYQLGLMY